MQTSAANAVLKMDGFVIQNKTLLVAISNPPPRKNRNEYSGGSFSGSSNRNTKDEDSKMSRQETSNKGESSSIRSGSHFGPYVIFCAIFLLNFH